MRNPYYETPEEHAANEKNKEYHTKLFEKYVPASGNCDTLGGEIVRALNKILYRWHNDGDKVGEGYGKETCNPAARFLSAKTKAYDQYLHYLIDSLLLGELPDFMESYNQAVHRVEAHVCDILREHPELFDIPNVEDMFDYSTEDDKDDRWTEDDDEDWL